MQGRVAYIDLKELSKRTSLCQRTIRSWVNDPVRPLPAYRVGGKLLFSWNAVEQWIELFRVKVFKAQAIADELIESIEHGNSEKKK